MLKVSRLKPERSLQLIDFQPFTNYGQGVRRKHDQIATSTLEHPIHTPFYYRKLTTKTLTDTEDDTPEIQQSKQLEIEAINDAETGQLDKSLTIINQAIQITPNRPSLYNNRAHIYQYQRKFDEAFNDLTQAIQLATINREKYQKTLTQAYCQRGILYKRKQCYDEARNDFQLAANNGSIFAKSQLVEMNPYAALCNQMLRKVMDQV